MGAIPETAKVGSAHQTLADAVTNELRELIVDGAFPAGMRLVEHNLADQLEVSRVPLREAIMQLEAEGLVRRIPRRGTVVATLTATDVVELFDVRESLEALAAGLAALRAKPSDLAVLARHLDQAQLLAERGEAKEIARHNVAFHAEIIKIAGSALLESMMSPLQSRMRWLFRILTASDQDQDVMCQEHSEIYNVIASGDREHAEKLAREHIARTREPTLRVLRAQTALEDANIDSVPPSLPDIAK
jgi:DNA-binding GntR family transcriptional regulator